MSKRRSTARRTKKAEEGSPRTGWCVTDWADDMYPTFVVSATNALVAAALDARTKVTYSWDTNVQSEDASRNPWSFARRSHQTVSHKRFLRFAVGRHGLRMWPSDPFSQKDWNSNVATGAVSFAQCCGPSSSQCRFLSWETSWRKSMATAGATSMSPSTKYGYWPGLFLML